MFKVFVADKLAPEGIDALKQYPELEVIFNPGLSLEKAKEFVKEADGIIVRSATKMKGELLEAAERVKVIGRAGIGVDNIDLDISTERGIVILNTPDANATTTAELAVAHMFSLSRNLPKADKSVRSGLWERNNFLGIELTGKTVGVIGFGTIGRLFAEKCIGLGMNILGFDPFVTEETFKGYNIRKVSLDSLLAESDYISLHCPVTDDTKNIISSEKIKLIKEGAHIINCARGGLIDETALLEAVENGHLAGAALDVFEDEPPGDSPLFRCEKIHFTPHLGASTHEAQTAVGVEIAHNIASYLIKGQVINAVNVPSIEQGKEEQFLPFIELGRKLGILLNSMSEGSVSAIEVISYGELNKLDSHPITSSVLTGYLSNQLSVPVNQINAKQLAKRQGIKITEIKSPDSKDYVSVIEVSLVSEGQRITVEGSVFDGRHSRLTRINHYIVESPLEGQLLITWHADQPGVIGFLGDILGRMGINISRMQVGVYENMQLAIAVLAVSNELDAQTLTKIEEIAAVERALQVKV